MHSTYIKIRDHSCFLCGYVESCYKTLLLLLVLKFAHNFALPAVSWSLKFQPSPSIPGRD